MWSETEYMRRTVSANRISCLSLDSPTVTIKNDLFTIYFYFQLYQVILANEVFAEQYTSKPYFTREKMICDNPAGFVIGRKSLIFLPFCSCNLKLFASTLFV